MKSADLYPGMWYRCPRCTESNFALYSEFSSFNCKNCGHGFNCNSLYESYGYSHMMSTFDNVNILASKFTCDCGKDNIVFSKTKVVEYKCDGFNKRIEGGQVPKFGLCEECFAGYDLKFVHPFV